jgi:hypothetical protein
MPKETTQSTRKIPNNWPGAIEQLRFSIHSTDQSLCPEVFSVPKHQGERSERALVVGEELDDILRLLLDAWTYKKAETGRFGKDTARQITHKANDAGNGVYTSINPTLSHGLCGWH